MITATVHDTATPRSLSTSGLSRKTQLSVQWRFWGIRGHDRKIRLFQKPLYLYQLQQSHPTLRTFGISGLVSSSSAPSLSANVLGKYRYDIRISVPQNESIDLIASCNVGVRKLAATSAKVKGKASMSFMCLLPNSASRQERMTDSKIITAQYQCTRSNVFSDELASFTGYLLTEDAISAMVPQFFHIDRNMSLCTPEDPLLYFQVRAKPQGKQVAMEEGFLPNIVVTEKEDLDTTIVDVMPSAKRKRKLLLRRK